MFNEIQRILERWLRPLPKCAYRWRRLFEFWHPPRAWHPSPLLLWAAPSMPECVANVFQGCAIYAGILKSKVSKPPQHSPSRLRSIFSLPFLLLLSLSPFRDKYAIGWHCPRWLRHLFSSLVVKKFFPRKTFVEHTSPLLFQRFDDRNVRSRKKEFKLKMG